MVGIQAMTFTLIDAIATVAFIGLVFLLGSIVFAAYMQTRPETAVAHIGYNVDAPPPTLRPTFTPTPGLNDSNLPVAEAAIAGDVRLPSPNQ